MPYRVGARESQLSRIQVQEVQNLLQDFSWELVWSSSRGDRQLDVCLTNKKVVTDNFFTDTLDKMLLDGEIDFTIHSAKDLPVKQHQDLEVVALIDAQDRRDALVSLYGSLAELPTGARIGTSSEFRRSMIQKLRPDCECCSIRGTIEARIEQLHQKKYDAIIVAACALNRLGLNHVITEYLDYESIALQGYLAIVACRNRPDLQKKFYPFDIRKKWGKVFFVGFGPGDPELLTVKGNRIIQESDVILYDDLTNENYLQNFGKELVYVGKRGGKPSISVTVIQDMMRDYVFEGKNIARVKGGDSGVFARLSEEKGFLDQWMMAYEVIPGVTSAVASAAQAKVPLTQRLHSGSFTCITAHHANQRDIYVPEHGTLCYVMISKDLVALKEILIRHGRSPEEQALVISHTSLPECRIQKCSLQTLDTVQCSSPATLLVGKIAEEYSKPYRVLYTGLSVKPFRSFGDVTSLPLIKTIALLEKMEPIDPQNGLIFCSPQAVKFWIEGHGMLVPWICAIGQTTARTLRDYGIEPLWISKEETADGVLETLQHYQFGDRSWVYPCSDRSSNCLHEQDRISIRRIYSTQLNMCPELPWLEYDMIVFTSPSTVDSFLKQFGVVPEHLLVMVQGKVTWQACLDVGILEERMIYRYGSDSST